MDLIILLIVGLIAGAIASNLMKTGGDWVWDLIFGVLGSFVGGWIFSFFRVSSPMGRSDLGNFVFEVIVATVGAAILIGIYRAFKNESWRG